jgi:hypothetical protein
MSFLALTGVFTLPSDGENLSKWRPRTKWPGSTLTDSRSRHHGKNEREGRAEPGQALRLIHGAGATRGMVARRFGVLFSASHAHYQPSKPALVVATFSPVCEGSRGAMLVTMTTRPGTYRGGVFARWHLAWPSVFSKPDDNAGTLRGESQKTSKKDH